MLQKLSKYVLFIPAIIWFFIASISLNKIGIGWDTPVNLNKGEQVFNFLTSLNTKYLFDKTYTLNTTFTYFLEVPGNENGHPPAFSFISYTLGHLFSALFGFKYFYFHIANVLLIGLLLVFMGLFYKRITKNTAFLPFIVASSLLLIGIPNFFVYALTSTKDVPVVVFSFISVYLLFGLNNKNTNKNFILSLFLFLLAFYSKFTAIFVLPVLLFLVYKNKNIILNKKTLNYSFLVFFLTTIIFWPQVIFNTGYELSRLKFVYFDLPNNSLSDETFMYFFKRQIPFAHLLMLLFSIFIISFLKQKKLFFFWVFPAIFYLIVINRYYQVFRQFLFLFPVLMLVFALGLNKITQNLTNTKKYLLAILFLAYSLYLLFLPVYKKVFYKTIFSEKSYKDVWGVGLPVALNYVYKNYEPTSIYFSPLSFLMEYSGVRERGFEIIYEPKDANIWIVTKEVGAYDNEKSLRESNYKIDKNFKKGEQSMEVWVKK